MRPINYDPRAFERKRSIIAEGRALARNASRVPSSFAWQVATFAAASFTLVFVVLL